MEAPVCKLCGKRHWSRLCYEPSRNVTSRVTRNANNVTEPVTPVTTIVTPQVADLEQEVGHWKQEAARLEAEVKHLKQQLSPMTAAERAKNYRKRKSGADA